MDTFQGKISQVTFRRVNWLTDDRYTCDDCTDDPGQVMRIRKRKAVGE